MKNDLRSKDIGPIMALGFLLALHFLGLRSYPQKKRTENVPADAVLPTWAG
jgi:hypothetical protein